MKLWRFAFERASVQPTPADAARALAKQGYAQRRAKVMSNMNALRAELGLPRFEGRAEQ